MLKINVVEEIIPNETDDKKIIAEAHRQVTICNACRYCEGFCSVFPAISRERAFSETDINHLANLCHNCRGCYYACQYTEPHEFAINLPQALAEVRQENWQDYATPAIVGKVFHQHGTAIALVVMISMAFIIGLMSYAVPANGEGFYGILSHNTMVSIFLPAFMFPFISIAISIRRYWLSLDAKPLQWKHITSAMGSVRQMKNLAGGHQQGCNYEYKDLFSHNRRWLHQAVMYGFLLCFAATSVATVMHYVFNMPAPYPLFSLPKLLGITGGILLCGGTMGMTILKIKADPKLSDQRVWGGEMAFILILFFVSATGLALYFLKDSPFLSELLVIHLGAVLGFFILMPFSKMIHGAYRLAALLYEEQKKEK